MNNFKIIIESLETFIKRSLMPSSSFLMMLILFDIYGNNNTLINFLKEEHHTVMITIIFIIFAGISILLTILHQFIYDNWIKTNYNPIYLFKSEKEALETLRDSVIKKLKTEDSEITQEKLTDYLLYQILGRKAKNKGKDLNTTRYVDDIKTIGIFFISLLIIIIISTFKYLANEEIIFTLNNTFIIIGVTIALFLSYTLGKELILSKYRSRAIRIYNNFLI